MNLLPILRVLLRERSISRAAQILGMTQPGASTALRRLRELLEDPLLIQIGHQMVLTDRARALIEPLEHVMSLTEKMLEPAVCDPATLNRRFKVWTVDYIVLQMAASLVPKLRASAPGASMRFVDLTMDALDLSLAQGDADIGIVPHTIRPPNSNLIDSQLLFREKFVALVSRDHPLAGRRKIRAKEIMQYSWAAFHSGIDEWSEAQQRALAGYGNEIPPVIQLQQLSALPLLAASTETIAILPYSAAKWACQYLPLEILELPGPPVEQQIHLMWSSVHTSDAVHRWFRDMIIEVATFDVA